MALAIATNNAALQSAAAASSVNRDMETSMARLSTGKRINSARDDAAGVAIASRLSSEIRGTDQAIRNAMDGQALIDTAEGGHKEIENILQRMREVAVQSANDTNDSSDRANLQAEMDALITEINRAASVTTWAGQSMMSTAGSTFSFQVGTATGTKNQIGITINSMAASSLTVGKTSTTAGDVSNAVSATVVNTAGTDSITAAAGNVATSFKIDGISFSSVASSNDAAGIAAQNAALATSINASEAMKSRGITATQANGSTWAKLKLNYAEGSDVFLDTAANARTGIGVIDAAIKKVNTQRSELGAVSNRLSHTVNNLTNISSNLSAAKGGIEDADFAHETTNLAKNQILQQASTAMLAQANATKQNVLSLLQQ
ncbi:MAG: flagellin [Paracoccaceae bacterium]|nr:flagellin [Paracoccaceae bacterium]